MPVTDYYTANGELIGEKTSGGSRTDYLTDALGSVVATVDPSAQVLNTYRYKPYGAQLARTGAGADPAFRWVGSLGYRQTGKAWSDVYVRARHYDDATGRWTTLDHRRDGDGGALGAPRPYSYSDARPTCLHDVTGWYVTRCWDESDFRFPYPPEGARWPLPLKPCNPRDPRTRKNLTDLLRFWICMMECECHGRAGAHCGRAFPGFGWERGRCGVPLGAQPDDPPCTRNDVANTFCIGRCGQCYGEVFYCDAFLALDGCSQRCFKRHEYVHADYCESQRPHRLPTTECEAYKDSIACARQYLRDVVVATTLPVSRVLTGTRRALRA